MRDVVHGLMEQNCWHCGHPESGSPFCRFCSHLQPPVPDYYEFLGIPRKLDVQPSELQKRFYTMSRLLHPDRYSNAGAKDRQYSLEATAVLNDAYRVLRDPVSRAEYFLKEQGFEGDKTQAAPADLLEEIFELNEALEDPAARPGLRERFLKMRRESDSSLRELFARYDREQSEEVLGEVRSALNRRRYVDNLIKQVDSCL